MSTQEAKLDLKLWEIVDAWPGDKSEKPTVKSLESQLKVFKKGRKSGNTMVLRRYPPGQAPSRSASVPSTVPPGQARATRAQTSTKTSQNDQVSVTAPGVGVDPSAAMDTYAPYRPYADPNIDPALL
ncbi:hypothetical protein BBP40_000333 [Aspergillus hancockii]|nr:hypothetical protein BBP40_000333 [Aspergillus hancockii]